MSNAQPINLIDSDSDDDRRADDGPAPPANSAAAAKKVVDIDHKQFIINISFINEDGESEEAAACGVCHHQALQNLQEFVSRLSSARPAGIWTVTASSNTTNFKKHYQLNHMNKSAVDLTDPENNRKWRAVVAETKKCVDSTRGKLVQGDTAGMLKQLNNSRFVLAPATATTDEIFITVADPKEAMVLYILGGGLPFIHAQNQVFRFFTRYLDGKKNVTMTRQGIAAAAPAIAGKIRTAMLRLFVGKQVTIVLDKGKIYNDYIPFLIVCTETGHTMLWSLVYVGQKKNAVAEDAAAGEENVGDNVVDNEEEIEEEEEEE